MAAVLAAGPDALLAGKAAGFVLGLLKGRPPAPEVIAPARREVPGLMTRTCRKLARRDGTLVRGIPVTTVPFTIVQLAADLGLDDLARACHEAGGRHRTTPRQVRGVLARRPNSPGAAKLRLMFEGDVPVILSRLEKGFLTLLRREGFVLPVTNRLAGTYHVGCRWHEQRLTVELDSYQWHNSRHAWQQGLRREREAYARGDDFRRYTWEDVFEKQRPMLTELRALVPGSG
jgi:hypothetical protein